MSEKAPRIVFMGTPEFAAPSLERLCAEGWTPVAVVTASDRPRGRGLKVASSAVKLAAQQLGVAQILQPESVRDTAFAKQVEDLEPDIIVVVAFRILPPEVFTTARLGAFNLHGSLLPAYRGAAPINRAIMAGESKTGVTTFFLKERVDTGNIILQSEMTVGPNETAGELHDRMMLIGADAVLETVRRIAHGDVQTTEQDDSLASSAPKVFRDDCRIDWSRAAEDVHNQIRGLSPFPGAFTTLSGATLKIFRSDRSSGDGVPGSVRLDGTDLYVYCAQDSVRILELQREGGRRMQTAEFLRGFLIPAGTVLGSER